jgi:hypothetical protein
MSLLPSSFGRKRNPTELRQDQLTTDDLRSALENPAPAADEPEAGSHEIFSLEPPSANDRFDPKAVLIPAPEPEPVVETQPSPASIAAVAAALEPQPAPAAPAPEPVAQKPAMDLSRLSIDDSGHLYWDGKPVEVRRRVSLSAGQILAAMVIGLFVILGGIGAAINGSAAAFEWGCKLGWIRSQCPGPTLLLPPPPAPPRFDIPA